METIEDLEDYLTEGSNKSHKKEKLVNPIIFKYKESTRLYRAVYRVSI